LQGCQRVFGHGGLGIALGHAFQAISGAIRRLGPLGA
jgi:hypothetical protein